MSPMQAAITAASKTTSAANLTMAHTAAISLVSEIAHHISYLDPTDTKIRTCPALEKDRV